MVRDIEPPISNVHNIYGFCFRIWASDVLILENLENLEIPILIRITKQNELNHHQQGNQVYTNKSGGDMNS